jgi:arylsulfatase A-like enzyme
MPKAPHRGSSALGLFLGLLALALSIGFAEVVLLALRRAWTQELVWVGSRVVWMAPVGYTLLAIMPAGLLACLAWRWPGRAHVFLAIGLAGLSLAGTIGILRLASGQRLHIVAMILLAAGVASQLSRAALRSTDRVLQVGRKAFPRLAGLLGLAVLGVEGPGLARDLSGWHPLSQVVPAPDTPNVLFILLDTVRSMELGLYRSGYPTSPTIDSLGAHAVVFENAFATAPWTLPSHASMFTGRLPHELGADWRTPLDDTYLTVAEIFQRHGTRTGGFVGNLYYTTKETGLDRGFERYEDFSISLKEILLSTELVQLVDKPTARLILRNHAPKRSAGIVDDFLTWQATLDGGPFFGFLNLFDAHIPRYAPDSILGRFAGLTGTDDEDRYATAIAAMDSQIGRLLRELRRRGVLERTVVVITSDHGEQFGEVGLFDHANSLYTNVIRVPLLVLLPDGQGAGLRVHQPVSLRNLGRTLVELGGLRDAEPIPGESLARYWTAADPAAEEQDSPVLSELTPSPRVPRNHRNARGELRSIVRGQWHYIVNGDGSTELYDYRADPFELHALPGLPAGSERALVRMRHRLRVFDEVFVRAEPEPSP